MPLLDHLQPPLSERRSWESFHSRWASALATWPQSGRLPPGHFAAVQLHVGLRSEVGVGTVSQNGGGPPGAPPTHEPAVATAVWAPPTPGMIMPGGCPDEIAVRIFNKEAGPTLVAAIELVSPRKQDREDARRAFAATGVGYLSAGIGLVLVDLVTTRTANRHDAVVV